jgi:hypothetical protein
MAANQVHDFSADVQKIYRHFLQWRRSHTGRLPIPEQLWAAAAELARKHGVFHIAKALHLEYGKLKERVEAAVPASSLRQIQVDEHSRTAVLRRRRSKPRPPSFVELFTPSPGSSLECRVELEGRRGKMRIEFKGIAAAELVALGRALWDGEE